MRLVRVRRIKLRYIIVFWDECSVYWFFWYDRLYFLSICLDFFLSLFLLERCSDMISFLAFLEILGLLSKNVSVKF